MTTGEPPIARIPLARSLPRLLLAPAIVALLALAIGLVGLLLVGGPLGLALAALGSVLVVAGAAAAAVLISVRLKVEQSAVKLAWIGGERVYPLTPGPVTRVRLRGESASRLSARSALLGWWLGPARLRDEETIEVVRLAATATAILVPTERGRLAIAASDEELLLGALSRAAQARERLEAMADRPPTVEEPPAPEPEVVEPEVVEPSAPLTGIERALLEERMAARAEAEREGMATEESAAQPGPTEPAQAHESQPAEAPAAEPARPRRLRRPAWLSLRRPRPALAFVALPLVGAGIAWGAGVATGHMPPSGTDLARLTSLALVLAGPATSLGAMMALAWWPRLVGVVVAGGLAASVFIGRALLGG